jgi:inositol transport system ATP-binding protein
MKTLLKMTGVAKQFPGVLALDAVDFEVAEGEVHALLGENGAGKSTLLKILSGAQAADSGEIEFAGESVRFASPHAAQGAGIATIYQEFTLAPDMSIAENVFIGREPGSRLFVSWGKLAAETRAISERIGLKRLPLTPVRELSVAEQQLVEIARALSMRSRLIVMDEPTSALSEAEVANLFEIVKRLRAEGISVIFVTHRLDEIFRICDRYTVLRDGRYVGAGAVADADVDHIIRLMVGRDVDLLYGARPAPTPGPIALEARGLTRLRDPRDPRATELIDVSLTLRQGEIVGLAGLVGAGRTETVRAIFGADTLESGEILIEGKPVRIDSPEAAMRLGIGLVPEDRKKQALFLQLAIRANLSIAAHDQISSLKWFVDERKENALVDSFKRKLNIRMTGPDQQVSKLSGGNQQKVVLARWLALKPKILIVDEPTRGIDVGAKIEVHNILVEMAKSGVAVLVVSSELPEVLALCDRIITMRVGRVTGEIARADATQEILMSMMALDEVPSAGAA